MDDPIVAAAAVTTGSVGVAHANLVVLDARPDAAAYATGHLIGAHHAQLDRDLANPVDDASQGGRHPLPDLARFCDTLGRWGITPKSHVVVYDDQGGANAAARLWWLLRSIGHGNVRVVDGGIAALLATRHQLTTEPPPEHEIGPYPASGFSWPMADREQVNHARTQTSHTVIDVRAAVRYRGEQEPIDPVNMPFTENLRPDGTFKSPAELGALYHPIIGTRAIDAVVVHCGSGVTACHSLLALHRAGLGTAALYVGSWSEWCRNPTLPREPPAAPLAR